MASKGPGVGGGANAGTPFSSPKGTPINPTPSGARSIEQGGAASPPPQYDAGGPGYDVDPDSLPGPGARPPGSPTGPVADTGLPFKNLR